METFKKDLKVGSMGVDVFALQRALQKFGFGTYVPTGYFGDKTRAGVIAYQKAHNIPATGYFGRLTRYSMNEFIKATETEKLYLIALEWLNVDASLLDTAPDEFGCADTFSRLVERCYPAPGIRYSVSTIELYRDVATSPYWKRVLAPQKGAMVISPTGYGNGKLGNGHVGVCGENNEIISNDSYTGFLQKNYTIETWKARYVGIGGFPMEYFIKK